VHADFELSVSADPLQLFTESFKAARDAEEASPDAMTLSTVDSSGMPDSRTVLLHWINDGRFQFSSYDTSAKGGQLKAHPKAALLFYWKKTGQVVRVRGTVKKFTVAQTENLRPIKRGSMDAPLHDWVIRQSEAIRGTEELEQGVREAQGRYPDDVRHGQCRATALLAPPSFRPMDCRTIGALSDVERQSESEWPKNSSMQECSHESV
jgi:pyridoxamine 5'-phosphate oxidase